MCLFLITDISKYSNHIGSAVIQALNLESLDLSNNKLRGSAVGHYKSVLTIGSWAVIGYYNASIGSNDPDGFLARLYPSEYTWGLPNLNELNLSGNGIYYIRRR